MEVEIDRGRNVLVGDIAEDRFFLVDDWWGDEDTQDAVYVKREGKLFEVMDWGLCSCGKVTNTLAKRKATRVEITALKCRDRH